MSDAGRDAVLADARDAVAAALPRAWAIYAYGSFARGDAWPGSGVDLAAKGLDDLLAFAEAVRPALDGNGE